MSGLPSPSVSVSAPASSGKASAVLSTPSSLCRGLWSRASVQRLPHWQQRPEHRLSTRSRRPQLPGQRHHPLFDQVIARNGSVRGLGQRALGLHRMGDRHPTVPSIHLIDPPPTRDIIGARASSNACCIWYTTVIPRPHFDSSLPLVGLLTSR